MNLLSVGLGGFLGAICRYGVYRLCISLNWNFPLATLVVNGLGCFAIGLFFPFFEKSSWHPGWSLFWAIGFLGSFTTFSAFGFETMTLLQDRRSGLAIANILLQLGVGLTAVLLGRRIGLAL